MKYNRYQLEWDVINGAIALKENATDEELSKLCEENLDPFSGIQCIYGQATGWCHSSRAIELINKCAVRFIANNALDDIEVGGMAAIKKVLNKTDKVVHYNATNSMRYFSPTETYIGLHDANIAALVAFLKNQTQTLEL